MRKSYFLPLIVVLFFQVSRNPAFGSASVQYNNYDFRNTLMEYKYGKKNPLLNKVSDNLLAQEAENIDLIIGGHTHIFLGAPGIKKNKMGQDVIINQIGFAGIILGRPGMEFSRISGKKLACATAITVTKKTEE